MILFQRRKGKPAERQGRKATDLTSQDFSPNGCRTAGLPELNDWLVDVSQ